MPQGRRRPRERQAPRERRPTQREFERAQAERDEFERAGGERAHAERAELDWERAERPSTQRKAEPAPRRRSDLAGRVLVAVPGAILAIVFVDLGGIGWTVLVALLGCACVSELYSLLEEWRPITLVGLVVVVGMCLTAHFGNPRDVFGVAAATLPLMFLGILARGDSRRSTLSIAATLLGVVWIGFAFSHAVLLRETTYGKGLVIDVLVGTFVADTAAYFGGRWFGRHLLAPTISPKKTIEGLGCGMLAAIVAIFCATLFQPWLPHGTALLLGLAVAVLGPMGDLFESLLKRDVGAKDAGVLFGAHGGALDRLDAVSFTIVAAYYIAVAVPALH
jgi:phosphatidate cytidylyltransferase